MHGKNVLKNRLFIETTHLHFPYLPPRRLKYIISTRFLERPERTQLSIHVLFDTSSNDYLDCSQERSRRTQPPCIL